MKINEKWTLFLIASFTTFFGITNNLLKTTEAKEIEKTNEFVLIDDNGSGLVDVIFKDIDFKFDSNTFSYKIMVDELDKLRILPYVSSDEINYKVNVIGDKNTDINLIVIITVDYPLKDSDVYTFYIEEK